MKPSLETLTREAAALGVRVDTLERVARLLDLLERCNQDPRLAHRLALKGGTALNLFIFDVPRLSVDLDLNYVASVHRAEMLADRQGVERALEGVAARADLVRVRTATAHAGGKWTFQYQTATGGKDSLQVDLNFMLRVPLWPLVFLDSQPLGPFVARGVPVLDEHELAAGKLAALLARRASRDLFDAHHLLTRRTYDAERLRLAFVIYGAMNAKDWRTVSIADVRLDRRELSQKLIPVLRRTTADSVTRDRGWADRLVEECRAALAVVLPLRDHAVAFVRGVRDDGVLRPDLLTGDAALQDRIRTLPMLAWRVQQRGAARASSGGLDT